MLQQDLLPKMARVPAGTFLMGDETGEQRERPAHRVFVEEFQVSVTAITNAQYARFVEETRHRAPAVYEVPLVVTHGGAEGEQLFRRMSTAYAWRAGRPPPDRLDHPVTLVRWQDAVAYCEWLAGRSGFPVRLPTEAEWEKAARGRLEGTEYPWGDTIDGSCANYLTEPSQKLQHGTRPVGSYPPNGYGVYDMAGNTWAWVADWYQPDYYASSPAKNPRGPASGRLRLVRGGAWLDADVTLLRCSHRHHVPADTYAYSIGFRIAY